MTLVARTREILLHPKTEWEVIAGEPASTSELYRRFIVPLAAIGPIAALIGWSAFGISIPLSGSYRLPLTASLEAAVVRYALGLIGVFVLAVIINGLAPTFGGQKGQAQALKLAAYSSTAAWLAGIFELIPSLSILGIVGAYSLYLLYAGLPIVMKAPPQRTTAYTVVVILCAIVLYLVIGAIVTRYIVGPGVSIFGM